jgi:hypothetical protein
MKLVAMGVSETGLIPQTSIFVHVENDDNSLHFGLPCFPITPYCQGSNLLDLQNGWFTLQNNHRPWTWSIFSGTNCSNPLLAGSMLSNQSSFVWYIYRRPELTTLCFVHCLIFCLISGLPLFKSDQPLFLNPGLRIYLQYSPVFGWQSQNINNNIIPA